MRRIFFTSKPGHSRPCSVGSIRPSTHVLHADRCHRFHTFRGKIEQQAEWTRGLFISYNGIAEDGLIAFGRGKRVICVGGIDMYEMLDREIPLGQVFERKVRRAAEPGSQFVYFSDLFLG